MSKSIIPNSFRFDEFHIKKIENRLLEAVLWCKKGSLSGLGCFLFFLILSKIFVFLLSQWQDKDITVAFLLNYKGVLSLSDAESAFFKLQVVELRVSQTFLSIACFCWKGYYSEHVGEDAKSCFYKYTTNLVFSGKKI